MAAAPPPPAIPEGGRQALPVAEYSDVRRYAAQIARRRSRDLGLTVGLFALAAVAGLFGPRLLGASSTMMLPIGRNAAICCRR